MSSLNHDIAPLPRVILDPIVIAALAEDLGRGGDITSDALIDADHTSRLQLRPRRPGVLAGMDVLARVLHHIDPDIHLEVYRRDGEALGALETIATLEGPTRSLLTAERTALNFLTRLSGIATLTRTMVDQLEGCTARLACTRKTTPGLRALEKRAVRLGGGINHRLGLDDAMLIKDNHIAAVGSITGALARARTQLGHLRMIELEVDTLKQLEEALETPPHAILLDNMDLNDLRQAVAMTRGRCLLTASGGVDARHLRAIAETGVDLIAVGALTHSAPQLDIGLDSMEI